MGLRGMEIQCGRGLRAQVAILYVEVGGANAELTTDTGELKPSFDPLCRVVSHSIIVAGDRESCSHEGGAAKVTREAREWRALRSRRGLVSLRVFQGVIEHLASFGLLFEGELLFTAFFGVYRYWH
jgi:hypothetical protein